MRALIVTNLYPTEATPTAGTFIERQVASLRDAGVDIEVLHFPRKTEGVGIYRSVPSVLRERITQFRPTVLHVMYGGVLAAQSARSRSGVPIVVSFAGTDLLGATLRSLITKQGGQPDRARLAMIYAGVLASRFVARVADANIVKASHMKLALPRSVLDKTWVIPNGVDLDRFVPMDKNKCVEQLGLDPDTFNVLFASGFHRLEKRPSLAKDAIERLKGMGVRTRLYPLDNIPPSVVPLWLNAADAVLMTSRQEGSPNVVKEALACNRPVVSVPVGDVEERLRGVSGSYVVEPDPHAIAEILSKIARSRDPSTGRGAVDELSLTAISSRVVDVYRTVTSGSHHRQLAAQQPITP